MYTREKHRAMKDGIELSDYQNPKELQRQAEARKREEQRRKEEEAAYQQQQLHEQQLMEQRRQSQRQQQQQLLLQQQQYQRQPQQPLPTQQVYIICLRLCPNCPFLQKP